MGGAFFFHMNGGNKGNQQRNENLYGNSSGLKDYPHKSEPTGSDGTREFRGHDAI